MYGSRVRARPILCLLLAGAIVVRAESPNYFVFVSNERSGDVTVIDGASDTVVATFSVGKRPRGIHAAPDGKRVFVAFGALVLAGRSCVGWSLYGFRNGRSGD